MALTVLAAYDVRDDGRRARVSAILQSWGDRVQRSVFLCTVPQDDLPNLLSRVQATLDLDSDSFLLTRQCASCWENRKFIGQNEPPAPAYYWDVM
jgi:CRISPR-associated protein Cas2